MHKTLGNLCLNLRAFPWETYGGDVRLLNSPEWSKGRAIKLTTRREDFMRHEVQGARHFYKKYRKQSLHALTLRPKYRCETCGREITRGLIIKHTAFNPQFRIHATKVLGRVKRDFVSRNTIVKGSGGTVTFVGVHDRRTDYLEFRRKRLKLEDLYHGYFEVRRARHLQIQKLTCRVI